MNHIKIDSSNHSLYNTFKKLYSISFPIFEQRTEKQQAAAFLSSNYHLVGYEEDHHFIGFISYWEFKAYIYVEHFAVNQKLRGKGYGSMILNDFIASADKKIVLLEIDPITDKISEARLRFYQKCGFYENPYTHLHPPYQIECKAHPLVILTTKRMISKDEYQLFNNDLEEIVMNKMRL